MEIIIWNTCLYDRQDIFVVRISYTLKNISRVHYVDWYICDWQMY